MKSVLEYVRSLFVWCKDKPVTRTSFKRDRNDDDLLSVDDVPAIKKQRQLKKTHYTEIMAENDVWSKKEQRPKTVRYVPVQIESGHPSTSTPNVAPMRKANRIRTVPIKIVGIHENGESSPRRSKVQTPTRPVLHAVLDSDDEQVTWTESEPENSKKLYINLADDDEINHEEDDDVIYVKKVSTPPPPKPYKFYYSKNNEIESRDEVDDVQYYKLKKIKGVGNIENTKNNKLRGSAGVTKSYKSAPSSLPKWMHSTNSNPSALRNRCLNTNGNARSTLSKVFDLEQKRSYQDLILQVANDTKPATFSRPVHIINLADEVATFRNTQKDQKKALNKINAVEKDLIVGRESEVIKEYDPITIASINSSDSEVDIIQSDCSTSSSVKIDPVNTLRDSFKDRAVCRDDWLLKLNSKYKQKKRDTREKLEDAQRESDIITKVNYEQKLANLAHKLKYELSIPESLIEEVPPETELPKLTPEQEKLVDRALGSGPPGQLMIEKFNLRIHRRDLQTLAGLNWLNDEVINFYMNLLMQRCEERTDLPKVYATNTFFYPKLMQSGQAGLRRWTRKVDVFAHDIMVIPVHLGVHWCLSLVDFRTKRIAYLDSMGARNRPCLNALLQYLRDEHQDKKGQPFNDKGWTTENLMDIPQQMNGSDCGMFACTFAEFSCRNAPFTFTQSHIPYLRRKAALEILQGKLLL